TALALLSACSYIMGANSRKYFETDNNKISGQKYKHAVVTNISIIIFITFIGSVGSRFLMGDFTAHSSTSLYILQLLTPLLILSSITFFNSVTKIRIYSF